MILQGSRWKGLLGAQKQVSSSIISESRQKHKKYAPKRKFVEGEKSNLVKTSKIDSRSQSKYDPKQKQLSQRCQKQHIHHDFSQINIGSPKKSQMSLQFKSKTKNAQDQLSSPSVINQLMKISQKENQTMPAVKVLFSLDQQHRYIHDELTKIKQDFIKFKEVVLGQLIRQQKQLQQIKKSICERLQQVFQSYKQQHPKIVETETKIKKKVSDVNFMDMNDIDSPNLSGINLQASATLSKIEVKKMMGEDSMRFEKIMVTQFDPAQLEKIKNENKPLKSDRVNNLPSKNSLQKCKKQFAKLFEAVNTLKNDIKQMNFSLDGTKQQHGRSLSRETLQEPKSMREQRQFGKQVKKEDKKGTDINIERKKSNENSLNYKDYIYTSKRNRFVPQ